MSLKGTKTKENLEAAFAGESQANRRYLYFAQKAASRFSFVLVPFNDIIFSLMIILNI